MKAGCTYVNTTEKTETSYFLAIYGQFRNISRLLRCDDFTTDLTQGEKFSGFFFFFKFRGNSTKNLHFPCINIIFIHLR